MRKIEVGDLTLTALRMGEICDNTLDWFDDAKGVIADGATRMPVHCLHIGGPGVSVLIDACDPAAYPVEGEPVRDARTKLAEAGVDADAISHVIFTHGHHDHFSGAMDAATGGPAFPAARHVISAADWGQGTLTEAAQMADGDAADPSAMEMLFHKGLLDIGAPSIPLPEGVDLLETPGETPGHRGVRISSNDQVFIYLADLFHVMAEVENPGMYPSWNDAAAITASRAAMADEIRTADAGFMFCHIPRVFAAGDVWS